MKKHKSAYDLTDGGLLRLKEKLHKQIQKQEKNHKPSRSAYEPSKTPWRP